MANLNDFPLEILERIFKFIDPAFKNNLSLVSKNFYYAVCNAFKQNTWISLDHKDLFFGDFQNILTNLGSVTVVQYNNNLDFIKKFGAYIRHIKIDFMKLSAAEIFQLVPNLMTLEVRCQLKDRTIPNLCNKDTIPFDDFDIDEPVESLKKLSLFFSHNNAPVECGRSMIEAMNKKFPNLDLLRVNEDYYPVANGSISSNSVEDKGTDITEFEQRLHSSGTKEFLIECYDKGSKINHFLASNRKFENVEVDFGKILSPILILNFVRLSKKQGNTIKQIKLSGRIDEYDFWHILESFPDCQSLHLKSCNIAARSCVQKPSPEKHENLRVTYDFSGVNIFFPSEREMVIATITVLRDFLKDLKGEFLDELLLEVTEKCNKLECLCILNFSPILASISRLQNLHTLTIYDQHQHFEIARLLSFDAAFENLTTLKVFGLDSPSSEVDLRNLAAKLTNVKYLTLSFSGTLRFHTCRILQYLNNVEELSVIYRNGYYLSHQYHYLLETNLKLKKLKIVVRKSGILMRDAQCILNAYPNLEQLCIMLPYLPRTTKCTAGDTYTIRSINSLLLKGRSLKLAYLSAFNIADPEKIPNYAELNEKFKVIEDYSFDHCRGYIFAANRGVLSEMEKCIAEDRLENE